MSSNSCFRIYLTARVTRTRVLCCLKITSRIWIRTLMLTTLKILNSRDNMRSDYKRFSTGLNRGWLSTWIRLSSRLFKLCKGSSHSMFLKYPTASLWLAKTILSSTKQMRSKNNWKEKKSKQLATKYSNL